MGLVWGRGVGVKWDGRNSALAPCQRQRALLGAAAFPQDCRKPNGLFVCLHGSVGLCRGKPLSRNSAIKADGGRLIWFFFFFWGGGTWCYDDHVVNSLPC